MKAGYLPWRASEINNDTRRGENKGVPERPRGSNDIMFNILVHLLALLISFACGYGVRELISRRRREKVFLEHPEKRPSELTRSNLADGLLEFATSTLPRKYDKWQAKRNLRQTLSDYRWHDGQQIKQLAEDIVRDEDATRLLLKEIAARLKRRDNQSEANGDGGNAAS